MHIIRELEANFVHNLAYAVKTSRKSQKITHFYYICGKLASIRAVMIRSHRQKTDEIPIAIRSRPSGLGDSQ